MSSSGHARRATRIRRMPFDPKVLKGSTLIRGPILPLQTRLAREARGVYVVSGLELWLAQALEQFGIWHGKDPKPGPSSTRPSPSSRERSARPGARTLGSGRSPSPGCGARGRARPGDSPRKAGPALRRPGPGGGDRGRDGAGRDLLRRARRDSGAGRPAPWPSRPSRPRVLALGGTVTGRRTSACWPPSPARSSSRRRWRS